MSILSDKTEVKALNILAAMVQQFERLHYLNMTAPDDWDATQARNLMEGIIQSNGYKIDYNRGSKRKIIKVHH